ncbi:MAG: hypothetical protein WAT12_14140 [Candidatus Nitrotoga sp.]
MKLAADDLFSTPLDQAEIDFKNESGETNISPFLISEVNGKCFRNVSVRIYKLYLPRSAGSHCFGHFYSQRDIRSSPTRHSGGQA